MRMKFRTNAQKVRKTEAETDARAVTLTTHRKPWLTGQLSQTFVVVLANRPGWQVVQLPLTACATLPGGHGVQNVAEPPLKKPAEQLLQAVSPRFLRNVPAVQGVMAVAFAFTAAPADTRRHEPDARLGW